MNKEIYLLYIRSKPGESGYRKRLKNLWADNFPELQHLTPKHFAEQIRNIKKKNLLNEIDRQLFELQHNIPQGNEENTTATGQNNLTLIETAENQIIILNTEPISNRNEEPEDMTLISDVRNKETVTEQNQMKKKLTELWKKNFQKYIELDIDQREYSTKVSPPPAQGQLEMIDEIISEQMTEIEGNYHNSLWILNVIYYTAAITLLEREGKLWDINRRKKERKNM